MSSRLIVKRFELHNYGFGAIQNKYIIIIIIYFGGIVFCWQPLPWYSWHLFSFQIVFRLRLCCLLILRVPFHYLLIMEYHQHIVVIFAAHVDNLHIDIMSENLFRV